MELLPGGERRCLGQTARFQETVRRMAMIDEGFVEDEARLGRGPAAACTLDPGTAALLWMGASAVGGLPAADRARRD